MATNLDQLLQRKENILAELAAFPPGPDYSVGGQSIQKVAHRKALLDELQQLNQLIVQEQPFEIRTVGM
jgi:hypothetical protein